MGFPTNLNRWKMFIDFISRETEWVSKSRVKGCHMFEAIWKFSAAKDDDTAPPHET